jgi:hypothetical protein
MLAKRTAEKNPNAAGQKIFENDVKTDGCLKFPTQKNYELS